MFLDLESNQTLSMFKFQGTKTDNQDKAVIAICLNYA